MKKNKYCKDVLTVYFDDIEEHEHDLRLISLPQAKAIVKFIKDHSEDVDTLLIHCFAGVSCSKAVGAFACEMLGITQTVEPDYNKYVFDILNKARKSL